MERIYLDNNATSKMDQNVIALINDLLKSGPYNPSSIHADGRKARGIMETARQQIANALGIDGHKDYQVTFTSSGTEANNLAINSFKHLPMLAGATEHVSVLESNHPNMVIIPVNQDGLIDREEFKSKLAPGKFVSIMLANNETGVIENIKELAEIAHAEGAVFHCDASQAFGKINFSLKDLDCDLLTISSHKCGGPLGAAALVVRKGLQLVAMIKGGKQEQALRAGTENILAIAGFGLAAENSFFRIEKFKKQALLRDYLEQEIFKISPDSQVFGSNAQRLPNTSCISMASVKNEEQLIKFDLAGISVSAGSACSSGRIAISHVLKAMNVMGAEQAIRVSLGLDNNREEIDKFLQLWKDMYIKGKKQ